jgi:hypothetical protein
MSHARASALAGATALGAFLSVAAPAALAQTTTFTYQGRLTNGGSPASGTYDLQLKLFDTGVVGTGTQQGGTLIRTAVPVSGGLFTVQLDFGLAPFGGPDRFLEIAVKRSTDTTFTTLGPRQPLTSEPYAVRSRASTSADGLSVACVSCVTSSQIQGVQGSQVVGPIAGSQIDGEIPVASVPAGSAFYIQNGTSAQAGASFNISGNGIAALFDAGSQFNIAGERVLSDVGIDNVFAGVGAGTAGGGFGNAFFGKNTGPLNVARYNAFFGFSAGFSTTTGCCNSVVGNFAGYNNTDGRSNVFMGGSAGFGNTLGSFNVFLGDGSGFDFFTFTGNTTGTFNTFVGYLSGRAVTTGNSNTFLGSNTTGAANLDHAAAIGAEATVNTDNTIVLGRAADTVRVPGALVVSGTLSANIFDAATQFNLAGSRVLSNGGTGNLFGGVGAGAANTTGAQNSFFGEGAGQNVVTGNENTFVGNHAGQNTGTGDSASAASLNTFVGSSAGLANVLGASVTLLGAHADVSRDGLDHATAIGADAVVRSSDTMVLGRDVDEVQVPGTTLLVAGTISVGQLGTGGVTPLCRNNLRFQLSTCSSSLRYKTDLSSFARGMDLVDRLRPIAFRWKEGGAADVGLAAEEVAEVEPLLITRNDKGEVEGVKYDHLSVVFINALKEQQGQIDQQRREIEAQQEQLRRQAEQIDALTRLVLRGTVPAAAQ